ncbi:MAG: hypothetical protein KDA42_08750 [Planctomycetales bacterium]|nr:hypothetical protein [Planctomycetales bacterium]
MPSTDPIIRDIVAWAIGFIVVSTVYLGVGLWLIRRWRASRTRSEAEADENSANEDATTERTP